MSDSGSASRPRLVGASRTLDLGRPVVMGVLNVTPDSFSDGGAFVDPDVAIGRALTMIDEGAGIIDIGGESTRPGAAPVDEQTELDRVMPVIETLRSRSDVFISIDTAKPAVMRAACGAGADMINDVNGLRAEGAIEAAAATDAAVCLMHMLGEPRTMQRSPAYDDPVAEIQTFLLDRVAECEAAGVTRDRICIDPGFGFGKTLDHNLALMRRLDVFTRHGFPVLVGVSRKSMFARLFGDDSMRARVNGSLAAAFWSVQNGAGIIRAHDVAETAQILTLAEALTD